jgi:hypothetical protein
MLSNPIYKTISSQKVLTGGGGGGGPHGCGCGLHGTGTDTGTFLIY